MSKHTGVARKVPKKKLSLGEMKASILSNLVAMDACSKECREIERQMSELQQRKNTVEETWKKHYQAAKELHKRFMSATKHSEYETGVYQLAEGRVATIDSHGSGIHFNTLTPLVK